MTHHVIRRFAWILVILTFLVLIAQGILFQTGVHLDKPPRFIEFREAGNETIIVTTAKGMVVEFATPVSMATITLTDNQYPIELHAFDRQGGLLDRDFGISEFTVFGGRIVKLNLLNATGKISSLRVFP